MGPKIKKKKIDIGFYFLYYKKNKSPKNGATDKMPIIPQKNRRVKPR